jgi:hypothetical protein
MATADSIGVEQWQLVPGYPRYRVSNRGRSQSRRYRNGLPADEWRDLKPVPDGHGYPQVRLYRDGERPKWFGLHQLVLLAFVGPPPEGMVGRHVLNNDPGDNRLENLAYGTQSQNCRDKELHGTAQRGERHWRALYAALNPPLTVPTDGTTIAPGCPQLEDCPRENPAGGIGITAVPGLPKAVKRVRLP